MRQESQSKEMPEMESDLDIRKRKYFISLGLRVQEAFRLHKTSGLWEKAVNDDAFDLSSRKEMVKMFNINMKVLKRYAPSEFDNISTTKIIERIKKL